MKKKAMKAVSDYNKKSSILIEFNGLPGCGKSTVCKKLEKLLKENNKLVCDYASYYKEISTSDFWRIKLLIGELKYGVFKICIYFIGLFFSIPKRTVYDFKYCVFICMNYFAIRRLLRKNIDDIIVSDEGLMQYMFSCFYDRTITNTYFIQKILELVEIELPGFLIVNAILDDEKIVKRIQSRSNGMSRIDKEDDKSLKNILKIQRKNLEIIKNCGINIKSFTISTETDPEIVAEFVWKKIGIIKII